MSWRTDIEQLLEDNNIIISKRGSDSPTPPTVIVRDGGMIPVDRYLINRAFVDVIAAFDTDNNADELINSMRTEVGELLFNWPRCILDSVSPAASVVVEGLDDSTPVMVSTIIVREVPNG